MPRSGPGSGETRVERRLARVEQILPTLATKTDLETAIAPLATKVELAAAIAPLATKVELAAAIAPLATKAELEEKLAAAIAPLATKVELREWGERIVAQTKALVEAVGNDIRDEIRIVAEAVIAGDRSAREADAGLKHDVTELDGR